LQTDYLMPAFYDYWSSWRAEDSAFWREAAQASRMTLRAAPVAANGLIPFEINNDGAPAPTIDYYDEVAARTLLNRWFSHTWSGPYPWVGAQSRLLLDFFLEQEDPLVSSYFLNGGVRGDRNTIAHIALSATAAAVTNDLQTYGGFLQAMVEQPIPEGESRYYDGMLYLISFLAVSGNLTAGEP
jgi:oligosaccharide reducing-end xylanase